MKRTLLILCWIQACLQAYASFGWKKYAVDDGLFTSEITSLERDRNGFLWVGSSNGL